MVTRLISVISGLAVLIPSSAFDGTGWGKPIGAGISVWTLGYEFVRAKGNLNLHLSACLPKVNPWNH